MTALLINGLCCGSRCALALVGALTCALATAAAEDGTPPDDDQYRFDRAERRLLRPSHDFVSTRFDTSIGWAFGRFDDHHSQYPTLGVQLYEELPWRRRHAAITFAPRIDCFQSLTITEADLADDQSVSVEKVQDYTTVEFAAGAFLPLIDIATTIAGGTHRAAHTDYSNHWSLGGLAKGGYGLRAEPGTAERSYRWYIAGGRMALGPDAWFDAGVAHTSQFSGKQLWLEFNVPLFYSRDYNLRVLFNGHAQFALDPEAPSGAGVKRDHDSFTFGLSAQTSVDQLVEGIGRLLQ